MQCRFALPCGLLLLQAVNGQGNTNGSQSLSKLFEVSVPLLLYTFSAMLCYPNTITGCAHNSCGEYFIFYHLLVSIKYLLL
jgi:hypothetical protein